MSYKSIIVHADNLRRTPALVKLGCSLANANEAHLVGLATTGLSRFAAPGGTELYDSYFAKHLQILEQQARQSLDKFETLAAQEDVKSVESRLVNDDAAGALSLQARYADLVVLGQTDPDEPFAPSLVDLPQYVVLNSARPVLVVPYIGEFLELSARVLVGWDASSSATRAVSNALPILKRAGRVDIAVFNADDVSDSHGPQPGTDIALYLARHGVKANAISRSTSGEVGEALLSMTAELGSSLMVMGCYGHTRFREIMLGGATRTILQSMTVPVLMSH